MLVSGSAAFGQLVRAAVAFARDDDHNPDHETRSPGQPVIAEPQFVCPRIKNNLAAKIYRHWPTASSHTSSTPTKAKPGSRGCTSPANTPHARYATSENAATSPDPHEQTERQNSGPPGSPTTSPPRQATQRGGEEGRHEAGSPNAHSPAHECNWEST